MQIRWIFEFALFDFVVLGPAMFGWLLVGFIFLHRAPVLARHGWGAVGAALAGLFLFAQHGLGPYLWIPVAGLISGLGWTLVLYGADLVIGVVKVWKAEGGISTQRLADLARRARRKD